MVIINWVLILDFTFDRATGQNTMVTSEFGSDYKVELQG